VIDGPTYVRHIQADGDRILKVAEGHLDAPVRSCPGNTVGSLLLHLAGACLFFGQCVINDGQPEAHAPGFGTDVFIGFRREHGRLIEILAAADPSWAARTWGVDQHVRFFHRRSAQELAVHRWDFEDALDEGRPIDAVLAADGIDEFLTEFFSTKAAATFDGTGQTFCVQTTDTPGSWTFAMHPDRIETRRQAREADVHLTGSASDLLLFLWGRIPPDRLTATGTSSLVERWQDRVRII
jgi:uncharacterized protein (TIGR03083 family)